MTLKEALEQFKEDVGKGTICIYGCESGGPGYVGFDHCCNQNHPTVGWYGGEGCPKNCKDFEQLGPQSLYGVFKCQFKRYYSYYYDKYKLYPFYGYKYVFSNFYCCDIELWGHKFNCGEQAFAWKKADTFKDYETANKILATSNPSTCKGLSKRVSNYNNEIWASLRFSVMYEIIYAKVTQDPYIKELLLNLKDMYIYEDSPYDNLWGVGLDGQGENLLGRVYMEVRDKLLEEQE